MPLFLPASSPTSRSSTTPSPTSPPWSPLALSQRLAPETTRCPVPTLSSAGPSGSPRTARPASTRRTGRRAAVQDAGDVAPQRLESDMEQLIELLQQIQELAGVAIEALQGAAEGGGGGEAAPARRAAVSPADAA